MLRLCMIPLNAYITDMCGRSFKAADRLASGEWLRAFSTTGCRSFWRDYARWLGDEPDPADLMRPFPAALMRMWPVSTRVNKPQNDDPLIVEPNELATDAA